MISVVPAVHWSWKWKKGPQRKGAWHQLQKHWMTLPALCITWLKQIALSRKLCIVHCALCWQQVTGTCYCCHVKRRGSKLNTSCENAQSADASAQRCYHHLVPSYCSRDLGTFVPTMMDNPDTAAVVMQLVNTYWKKSSKKSTQLSPN